jgi:hypothetical protein
VHAIPESAWSKYPRHSPQAVRRAVDEFLASLQNYRQAHGSIQVPEPSDRDPTKQEGRK